MAVNEGFHRECESVRRRMAMTRRGRVLALQVSLDRTALALTKMEPEEWFRWGSYFIETIDLLLGQRHVLGEVREEFLRQVRDRIMDRLAADGW